jgi:catechol 2,3-dioxygenase-like lactoylglutathione lyase family enzyme
MSIDHVSIGVLDMKKSQAFYDAVLAPLGLKPVMPIEVGGQLIGLGYGGADGHPTFWVQLPYNRQPASQGNGTHIAFRAATRAAVDAFYLAALDHGGIDDGKPGIRHDYHPNYYGAFVRDLIGNKIEACCHTPE